MSIIHDVKMCIREIDRIGISKKSAREKGVKAIHSKKTKNEVRKISMQFANYVRGEFNIKKLFQVEEKHYKAFLDSKSDTTLDYRRGIETHLRLLQVGLNKRAERFEKSATYFCTEKRLIPSSNRLEAVSNRSLSQSDINVLKANVSESTRHSIELMQNLGFRVSGSVSVKVENINFDKGVVSVIEKGGRYREVPIPKGFEKKLAGMIKDKEPFERLIPIKSGTVSDDIKQAAKKNNIEGYTGTHAFRHTYCRNRVNELMTKEEKDLFQKCISRYVENKEFNYGVHNQKLYDSMKSKMDQIHDEIGHGKSRYHLAVRYMRE